MSTEQFLDRVFDRVPDLDRSKYNHLSWRHADHPTSEGVGLLPGVAVDVEAMVACILDVEEYADNIRYVKDCTIMERRSDTDVTYVQRMELPLLGGLQVALRLADLGQREGYRVVAWGQDNDMTERLDKRKGGARTAYNYGAWLLTPDAVAYALSSAPRKSDVGGLKFTLMTRGADATAGEVLKQNIEGMIAWSQKR